MLDQEEQLLLTENIESIVWTMIFRVQRIFLILFQISEIDSCLQIAVFQFFNNSSKKYLSLLNSKSILIYLEQDV